MSTPTSTVLADEVACGLTAILYDIEDVVVCKAWAKDKFWTLFGFARIWPVVVSTWFKVKPLT